jgi:hypothetical protein
LSPGVHYTKQNKNPIKPSATHLTHKIISYLWFLKIVKSPSNFNHPSIAEPVEVSIQYYIQDV